MLGAERGLLFLVTGFLGGLFSKWGQRATLPPFMPDAVAEPSLPSQAALWPHPYHSFPWPRFLTSQHRPSDCSFFRTAALFISLLCAKILLISAPSYLQGKIQTLYLGMEAFHPLECPLLLLSPALPANLPTRWLLPKHSQHLLTPPASLEAFPTSKPSCFLMLAGSVSWKPTLTLHSVTLSAPSHGIHPFPRMCTEHVPPSTYADTHVCIYIPDAICPRASGSSPSPPPDWEAALGFFLSS